MLLLFALWLGPSACADFPKPAKPLFDTSAFEYVDRERSTTLRQRGDTTWSISQSRTMMIVDRGNWLLVDLRSDTRRTVNEFCVRGDRAYPIKEQVSQKSSVPVSTFRDLHELVESTRKHAAIMRRVP